MVKKWPSRFMEEHAYEPRNFVDKAKTKRRNKQATDIDDSVHLDGDGDDMQDFNLRKIDREIMKYTSNKSKEKPKSLDDAKFTKNTKVTKKRGRPPKDNCKVPPAKKTKQETKQETKQSKSTQENNLRNEIDLPPFADGMFKAMTDIFN